jgi:hypothetical protein
MPYQLHFSGGQQPPLAVSRLFFSPLPFCYLIETYLTIFPSPEIHSSAQAYALSKFSMPAMSPTMTEGGIASWKKKEGESFAVGDVLLEIVSNTYLSKSLPRILSFIWE